jgi:NitT/TauT family transport system substrate-binding protein
MIGLRAIRSSAVLAAILLNCGAPQALAQSQPALRSVRVATSPVTQHTPLLIARDKGWFAEQGLAVSWSMVAQTAIAIEAVYGGSSEFGAGGIVEPMVARAAGLDLMFAIPSARTKPTPPDNSGLMVRANSDIHRAADLVGKKVSVGLLNSITHIHMIEWLRKAGVDAKAVQFIEIPFPQMGDALLQNRLDAVWAVEPFLTIIRKSGNARVLAYPYVENLPGMDVTALFAKETWLKANADVATRFRRTYQRAVTYLNETTAAERAGWIAKFTGARPELVAEMSLPDFPLEFGMPSLRANMDLVVQQKLVAKPFSVDTMVWKP